MNNSEAFAADVDAGTGALLASSAEATTLTGSTAFTNSEGNRAELFFRAERARLTFEDGELALLEGYASELTTCHCCNVGVVGQPYSLRAEKLLLYPDRLFVAYGITGRAAGVAIVWLPLYVQPLKETLEAPLFPAVGRSATHGWFAKWSLPFFASESLYGYVSIDAYPFTRELGLGGSVRYDVGGQEGELYVYRLPAKVGDSEAKVRLRHTSQFAEGWSATGALDYAQVGAKEKTTYSFALDGATRLGDVTLVASRALSSTQAAATHVEERLPELTLDVDALRFGTLSVQPRLAFGWRREGTLGETLDEAIRLVAQATIAAEPYDLAGLRLTPAASVRGAIYDGETGRTTQASFAITPGASIGDLDLSWSSTWVIGTSPLESDRASAGHVFRWSFSPSEPLDLVFRGSLDLAAGLGPLSVAVAWSAMADWKASGTFEPQDNAVTAFQLSGTWTDDTHTATWLLPWDASSGRFEKSTLELSAVTDPLSLSLAITADLARRAVSAWKVDAELTASGGWGLSAGAAYTAASRTLVPNFGLFQDIADCLRVGVEYAHRETWLYISILAFPEAVLRYAPRTFEVEVGD